MREIAFHLYDVFTDQPFSGNQLGVVPDASGLADRQMQAIAREFNLSETIFFLPPSNPSCAAKVRIFMPNGELPFAGHPTIGGAIAYAGWRGLEDQSRIVLEEGIGPVACVVSAGSLGGQASFSAVKLPEPIDFSGSDSQIKAVAKALRLQPSDIGFGAHRICASSGGVPFVTVPVASLDALSSASIDSDAWLALDVERQNKFAVPYLYCRTGDRSFQARMFAPWDGIPEDPATGSAAVAFGATLHRFEAMVDGVHEFSIRQGVEMGRPSDIGLAISISGNAISAITISGKAVKTASGTLFLRD
jgi:trans-2,3-dihydro-3-hydroxyanthranilate isomerase